MTRRNRSVPGAGGGQGRPQRGAVLVVGLIFLALLTLIGVAAYSVLTQEERMAGNARDRLRAFEAAEAALRHCERLLSDAVPPNFQPPNADPGMFITPDAPAAEVWDTVIWKEDEWKKASIPVPDGTVAGVREQPRCIVERQPAKVGSSNASLRAELPQSAANAFVYKITARGVGANLNSVVRLQTTFIRD